MSTIYNCSNTKGVWQSAVKKCNVSCADIFQAACIKSGNLKKLVASGYIKWVINAGMALARTYSPGASAIGGYS